MRNLKELSDLKSRTALITGATGGLGKVFSETLAELGCNLILVDVDRSKLEKLKAHLVACFQVEIDLFCVDLELENLRSTFCKTLITSETPLDIIVNNAAFVGSQNLSGWNETFESQSLETWHRALEVNLTSIFHLCRDLYPKIKKSKHGSIINISSIYGLYAPNWSLYEGTNMGNPAAYAVSKSGLIQLTRWLATTLAPEVRVNSIVPGGVLREQPNIFVSRYSSQTPLRRMANEEDFRGAMAFLASDMSAYVTGQTLIVDGGFGIW
jgi:NAD(P)-dependent dehydrogenase (short-subunit alcohol dehydrogenase family)